MGEDPAAQDRIFRAEIADQRKLYEYFNLVARSTAAVVHHVIWRYLNSEFDAVLKFMEDQIGTDILAVYKKAH